MTAVVQMGHVPRTSGATGAPGEQAYARGVAARVEALLARDGLPLRIIFADPTSEAQYRGDLFLAIHYDASSSPSARGGSVGHATDEGRSLASRWKAQYQARGFAGGFRADNYTVALAGYYGNRAAIRQGNRAAAILEGGFGSHTTEGPWLRSSAGMDVNAWAIRDSIRAHYGLPATTPPLPKENAMAKLPTRLVRAWKVATGVGLFMDGTEHDVVTRAELSDALIGAGVINPRYESTRTGGLWLVRLLDALNDLETTERGALVPLELVRELAGGLEGIRSNQPDRIARALLESAIGEGLTEAQARQIARDLISSSTISPG